MLLVLGNFGSRTSIGSLNSPDSSRSSTTRHCSGRIRECSRGPVVHAGRSASQIGPLLAKFPATWPDFCSKEQLHYDCRAEPGKYSAQQYLVFACWRHRSNTRTVGKEPVSANGSRPPIAGIAPSVALTSLAGPPNALPRALTPTRLARVCRRGRHYYPRRVDRPWGAVRTGFPLTTLGPNKP